MAKLVLHFNNKEVKDIEFEITVIDLNRLEKESTQKATFKSITGTTIKRQELVGDWGIRYNG